jgi:hypothetical protein
LLVTAIESEDSFPRSMQPRELRVRFNTVHSKHHTHRKRAAAIL